MWAGGPFGGGFRAPGAEKTISPAAIQVEGARQMITPTAVDDSVGDFQMFDQMFREHVCRAM